MKYEWFFFLFIFFFCKKVVSWGMLFHHPPSFPREIYAFNRYNCVG